ncbi:NAD(P)-dependent alcohol dehydrogenase [Glycomyces tenuis]|uniref:NAD(P)-dependent alcohol dehydrogenase n=1 Tax=Glycomyces tenuis TaxID=58116 RepID=UPI0003FDDB23|nr:NAD(P)-dependent alcohol dehydrogenase [Glycomyces tenuis]
MPQPTMRTAPMRAVRYDRYGPPEVLNVREVPRPEPKRGQILVRVHAAAVNAVDAAIRAGSLRLATGFRFPKATGADFAGTVAQVGPGGDESLVGRAVWGAVNPLSGRTAAEYIAVEDGQWSPAPAGLDLEGAAALPTVGISALLALDAVGAGRGRRLLVVGASGGVGNAAVQLAAAAGASVATVSSKANLDFCRTWGAEDAYAYDERADLDRVLREERFDAILDVHGTAIGAYRRRLRPGGRMVTLAARAMPAALASAVLPGPRVRLVQMRPTGARLKRLTGHVERGELRPVVDRVYRMDEIAEAHRSAGTGHSRGKRVVLVAEEGD